MGPNTRWLFYCDSGVELRACFDALLDFLRREYPNKTIATFGGSRICVGAVIFEFVLTRQLPEKTRGAHWDCVMPAFWAIDIIIAKKEKE
jgi:hypothetical protein